jgi:hypothetical protein
MYGRKDVQLQAMRMDMISKLSEWWLRNRKQHVGMMIEIHWVLWFDCDSFAQLQNDFASQQSITDEKEGTFDLWSLIFDHWRCRMKRGCSHFGSIQNRDGFGKRVERWWIWRSEKVAVMGSEIKR